MLKHALVGTLFFFILLACNGSLSAAGIYYNDYSSSPITGDTGLSSSTTPTYRYVYIQANGVAGTSNPGGNYVGFEAYRDRNAVILTTKIEEYVRMQGNNGAFNSGYLSEGAIIDSSLSYNNGDLLYQTDGYNPPSMHQSNSGYLGFRISDGDGDYYYGWAEVHLAEIQIVNGSPSDNRASIAISRVAVMDTAGISIDAGQTVVPEPASLGLLGLGAIGLLKRRKK